MLNAASLPSRLLLTTAFLGGSLLVSTSSLRADSYDDRVGDPPRAVDPNDENNFDLPDKASDYARAQARVRTLRVDRAAAAEELATVRQRLVQQLGDNERYEEAREAVQELEERVAEAMEEAMEALEENEEYQVAMERVEVIDARVDATAAGVEASTAAQAASPSVEEVVNDDVADPAPGTQLLTAADMERQELAQQKLQLQERIAEMREEAMSQSGDYPRLQEELEEKKEELRDVVYAMRRELQNNPEYAAAEGRVNDLYDQLQQARTERAAAGAEYEQAAVLEEEEDVQERTFDNDYGYWDRDYDIELD